jgi:DNA-directed RNA polymerase specialized sigma24 family protein
LLENELDIKKAQKGDHEAFTRLFRQLESQLYRLAKTILLKDEDCANALQETTLEIPARKVTEKIAATDPYL